MTHMQHTLFCSSLINSMTKRIFHPKISMLWKWSHQLTENCTANICCKQDHWNPIIKKVKKYWIFLWKAKFFHKKCTQSQKQYSNMIEIHCIDGSLFVFIEIKEIRNSKNVEVFCQKPTFSPKMQSTVTKVILTDKYVHTKSCLWMSKVVTEK